MTDPATVLVPNADDGDIAVRHLNVVYQGRQHAGGRAAFTAVDHVSFDIPAGTTLALVGESGSGKTSVANAVMGLAPATGSVIFSGRELIGLKGRAGRAARRRAQMVFQDPYSSLDPAMRVASIVGEPLRVHGIGSRRERLSRVAATLEEVGLAASLTRRYPSELSGGQRQRVAIARAIAAEPAFVVCDEPTSALDVSVQARIVGLLQSLQESHNLSYLFVTHNLGVAQRIAHRVAVMYRGRIVERGTTGAVFSSPANPYTVMLLESVLSSNPAVERKRITLRTRRRDNTRPGNGGCPFVSRCPFAIDQCSVESPPLSLVAPDHWTACHRWRHVQQEGHVVLREEG